MNAYDRAVAAANLHWRLNEIRETCRRQRVTLLFERERVSLLRDLTHTKTRLQMRRTFLREVNKKLEVVVRPLVESVSEG
jgi:hypothetical protein